MPDSGAAALRAVWRPFLLSRLWVALFVYLGHASFPYRKPVAGGWIGVDNWWLNPWTTYDSKHFLAIAQHGYTPETAPFFPLYPLLLRPFAFHENAAAGFGILLSNLAFFAGLWFLFDLTQRDYDRRTAQFAVWILAFFPVSAIFSAVYTDALYFACLMAGFWSARRGQWPLAGLATFLAALTRNSGAVITAALLCEWLRQRRGESKPPAISISFVFLPLLALIGVQLYLRRLFGGMPGVSAHANFGRAWQVPWLPLWHELQSIGGGALDIVTLVNFAATLAALFFVVRYWKEQPKAYAVLLAGIILMQLGFGRVTPPFTNTSARLLATTFPFAQLLGRGAVPLTQNRLRLCMVAAGYLLICALFSFLLGQRQFVCG